VEIKSFFNKTGNRNSVSTFVHVRPEKRRKLFPTATTATTTTTTTTTT